MSLTPLDPKVLQLGITFKENCPDIRNSHAVDVVRGLQEFGCEVDIYDPWADPDEVRRNYGLHSLREKNEIADGYDAVVLVVAHREFTNFDVASICREGAVIFDVKGLWPQKSVTARL